MKSIFHLLFFLLIASASLAQQPDLLRQIPADSAVKTYVTNAFKSTRVINGQSMEFLGAGVMDVRILHRFGLVNSGFNNLYGLDEAQMRLGFDYGLGKSLMIGFGRSTFNKEWDGFIKYRPLWQSDGPRSSPVSIVLVADMTINTVPYTDTTKEDIFSNRLGYYYGVVVGRKFNQRLSIQLTPEIVYRNIVPIATDDNLVVAAGIGARYKVSKRVAIVVDYHHIFSGLTPGIYQDPLSVGVDIETGGHVFQLHFSNSQGMTERAFLTQTTDSWGKGEIRFGFNLSRVFTVHKPKSAAL